MKPPITFRKSKTDGWQIIDRARHCVAVADNGKTAKAICDAVNGAVTGNGSGAQSGAYPQTLDKTETAGEKEANANSRATEQRRDPQMPRKRGRPKRIQA